MKPVAPAPFRISDAMILLAASAIGLALIGKDGPSTIANLVHELGRYFSDPRFVAHNHTMFPWVQVEYIVAFPMPLLASFTLALAMIRLIPPRPGWARLARQPGAVACLVASVALILEFGTAALFYKFVKTGFVYRDEIWVYVLGLEGFRRVASRVSFSVGAAWFLLRIGGRWRAEPTWIDRAGRAIGICWVALIPLYNWSILR